MLTLSRGELEAGIEVSKMREEDYSQKGEGMTELTLKGETYRIRRADPRNLVIERLQKPKDPNQPAIRWESVGYYGRVEDLAHGLVKFAVDVPEAQSLSELAKLLRQEVKNVEASIITELKRHQLDTTSLNRQGNNETEPHIKGVKTTSGL